MRDLTRRACAVRERILQWVGIPCCIGIAETKTLGQIGESHRKRCGAQARQLPIGLGQDLQPDRAACSTSATAVACNSCSGCMGCRPSHCVTTGRWRRSVGLGTCSVGPQHSSQTLECDTGTHCA
ncbi:MAG: hypothetical protein PBV86_21245 [Delftia lacustris]